MSHDPDLMPSTERKLDDLLRQYPEAKVSGLLVRINNVDAVVVTKEGRFEWFKLNAHGGIKHRETLGPDSVDTFGNNILHRSHTLRRP